VSIALIWAMSRNRVIGKDNQLPWHLPDDLRFFKNTTKGAPIIVGRLTFESMGGPLPGRTNIVVTSGNLDGAAEASDKVLLARCIEDALELAKKEAVKTSSERCFVCGGEAIYGAALPLADELFVTQVDVTLEGDAFFPEYDPAPWQLASEQKHDIDEQHAHGFSFLHYTRRAQ